jgi:ABC-type transport system involved in multi-copper enzyme maturation permease subunit
VGRGDLLYVALWLAFAVPRSHPPGGDGSVDRLRRLAAVRCSANSSRPRPVSPAAGASVDTILGSLQLQQLIDRLLPSTLYNEISLVLLNPSVTQVSTPATIDQFQQAQQQIPTLFSLDQSLLLVWPHVVALVALMVVCFAGAYVAFMRQEVRA